MVDYTPEWAGGDSGANALEHEEDVGGTEGRQSNGTHFWDRTVILVSLDGVQAGYLEKGLTPHLLSLSKKGIVGIFVILEYRTAKADTTFSAPNTFNLFSLP